MAIVTETPAQPLASATAAPAVPKAAWYIFLVLALLFCLSFIDRQILALLADPIGKALAISDTKLGLLIGASFGIIYATLGLPLASWADQRGRIRVVVGGAIVWSVLTIVSAFTTGFMGLAFCRTGVAIGEAALTPAAISIIADLYPREKRSLPLSLFSAISAIMSTGAFFVGGLALDLATRVAPAAGMEPWRLTLVIVGIPGILLALLLLATVKEPARRNDVKVEGDSITFAEAVKYVVQRRRLFGWLYPGIGIICIVVFGLFSWTSAFLVRTYGYTPQQAGYTFGLLGMAGSVAGAFLWPALARAIDRRGRLDGPLIMLAVCSGVGGLSVLVAPWASSAWMFLLLLAPAFVGFGGISVLASIGVQAIAPSRMRARLAALSMMSINLIGFVFGPLLVAWSSDHLFHDHGGLRAGLSAVALVMTPAAIILFLLARKGFIRETEDAR